MLTWVAIGHINDVRQRTFWIFCEEEQVKHVIDG